MDLRKTQKHQQGHKLRYVMALRFAKHNQGKTLRMFRIAENFLLVFAKPRDTDMAKHRGISTLRFAKLNNHPDIAPKEIFWDIPGLYEIFTIVMIGRTGFAQIAVKVCGVLSGSKRQ
jgi:hypothetical protein